MTRIPRALTVAALLAAGGTAHATEYQYDSLDRLVRVVRNDGSVTAYGYDAAGNVTSVTTKGRSAASIVAGLGVPGTRCPDRDVYTFEGEKGETVTVRLEAEPREAGIARRISLTLTGKEACARLRRQDVSVLPNELTAVLPESGTYEIVVHRQQEIPQEARYAGAYRLTLEARPEACASFRAAGAPH